MIAQTIQLALAPVFVLVAIGNIINTLSSRLGRVVDRSRTLQKLHGETEGAAHDAVVREIRIIDKRIHLISRSLLLLVLAGLCIGSTVVLLFVEEFIGVDVQAVAAGTFILAIGFLMNAKRATPPRRCASPANCWSLTGSFRPFFVIARSAATKQSSAVCYDALDCFASLAMTIPPRPPAGPAASCPPAGSRLPPSA